MLRIQPAETTADFDRVRELMAEYIEWDCAQTERLGLDPAMFLDFYYPDGDPALPGVFGPPEGCLLLATHGSEAAGCGAFRPFAPGVCEMKRMYVRPQFRGRGIARQMAETLIATARGAGYRVMRLDTTTFMGAAQALYASLGFQPREAYYDVPESLRAIALFMEKDLGRAVDGATTMDIN